MPTICWDDLDKIKQPAMKISVSESVEHQFDEFGPKIEERISHSVLTYVYDWAQIICTLETLIPRVRKNCKYVWDKISLT